MKILLIPGLFLVCIVAGCSASPPLDDLGTVPEFSLPTSEGGTLTRQDLDGKVWVAAFVFTNCGGPCPQVTSNMQKLHDDFKKERQLRFVTITVDPERDTVPVLHQYAQTWKADTERWYFVTGNKQDVYSLIVDGFKLAATENQGSDRAPGNEFIHSPKLALVDRKGHIRGYYDGRKTDQAGEPVNDFDKLEMHIRQLLRE